MQDRFKFRVWSKKYNKFIEDNRYPIGSDYQLIITQSGTLIKLGLGDFEDDCEDSYSWATFDNYEQDCIITQCTGLKDKNGKLIYELDYVRYSNNTYKVEIDKFLGISLTNISNGDTIIMDDIVLFNCEVIGNEFESNTKI